MFIRRNRLDIPVKLYGRTIKTVYLAGKITGTNWRDQIAEGWSEENHGLPDSKIVSDGTWETVENSVKISDGRYLDLAGPWWRSFYDCGGHSSISENIGQHAFGKYIDKYDNFSESKSERMKKCEFMTENVNDVYSGYDGSSIESVTYYIDKNHLISNINKSLLKSDLVFSWIDSADCYGTLAELGIAGGIRLMSDDGKPLIVVATPPQNPTSKDDLWLGKSLADRRIFAENPADAWRKLWETIGNM